MKRSAVVLVLLLALCALPALAKDPRSPMVPLPASPELRDLSSPEVTQAIADMRAEIAANGWTFEVGPNPAMQYDLDQLCGRREELLPPEMHDFDYNPGEMMVSAMATGDLPTRFIGRFTSPRDQGQCGSCWAFSTIDETETAVLNKTGAAYGSASLTSVTPSATTPDLSEEHVLSCNPYRYSCSGGNIALAMLVAPTYKGAMPETCFPYTAKKKTCKYCANPVWTPLSSWGYLTSDTTIPTEAAIQQAIYNYGAVTAYIYADSLFQAYTGGVFNDTKSYTYTNHAIQLVGWDTNIDGKGTHAWLLKNSWGPNWGVVGYMWIKVGTVRVGEGAAWAVAK
jgi:C1A family cysteine protease